MKKTVTCFIAALSVCLLVLAGCGEEKTIYEDGTGLDNGGSTTPDTTPVAFTFTSQTGVALGASVTSDSITVSGINQAAPISVSGGTYSIGSGNFTSAAGTVTNGQTVRVQHTASASNATDTTTTLSIGGVTGTFKSTTVAANGGGGGGALSGEAQYKASCGAVFCHGVPSNLTKAHSTVAAIKGAGMAFDLDDTQLKKIEDYLLAQP